MPRTNWQHSFTGGPGVRNRSIPCPRGKLFGGCTSVNGTVYMRGHRLDYDEWAALGNDGWSYDEVLPWYRRHEAYDRGGSAWHGTQGELNVQRLTTCNPLAQAFVDAGVQAGHARNDDFNGPQQDGFGLFDLNQRDGVRWSSSRAFLHPVLQRPNLTVLADALVERVRLQGRRAVGVTLRQRGQRHGARRRPRGDRLRRHRQRPAAADAVGHRRGRRPAAPRRERGARPARRRDRTCRTTRRCRSRWRTPAPSPTP
jgi:choline dehydrogenase